MKRVALKYSFDELVDEVVLNSNGEKIVFILLNLDQELVLNATAKRSSVQYLKYADNCEILHIDSLQTFFIYIANLLWTCMKQIDQVPIIVTWGLMRSYGESHKIELTLSKLFRLPNVIVGETNDSYKDILKCYTTDIHEVII